MAKPLVVAGLRGRNGADNALALPDWQCCEAINVELDGTGLATRRAGSASVSLTFGIGLPFTGGIVTLLRFVPVAGETAAELWAVDSGTGRMGRLAGAVTWTAPTLKDSVHTSPGDVTGVSLGGSFWLTYATNGVNRSAVWDPTLGQVRRRGSATPAAPTLATNGGAGLTFTRFYRVRWVRVVGSDTVYRSEPSASATITITDDVSVRVTRPALAGEAETHWEVEYADADAGPWYVRTRIVTGTTFFDDADATVDDTLDLSAEDGVNVPPPDWKVNVKAGGRLLCAGCWQTTAGDSFVPLENEVYWTPVEGASDIGDLERQPIEYRVTLDHPVIGLSEGLNGTHYAFGYRGLSSLHQTDAPGEGAFVRRTERLDLGCIRHQTILTADDEFGRSCIYFLSHRGPYRIGPEGMQYLGRDIEDVWETVNLDAATIVAHGTYYADRHEIWYWVATDDAAYPDLRLRFDVQNGIADGEDVRGGWTVDDGLACAAACSVAWTTTNTAGVMSRSLVPHFGSTTSLALYKGDTGTDDAGTDYQAYLDTKEYTPAGLGMKCALREPHLVGEANQLSAVTVTPLLDFGRRTSESSRVVLAPEGSESHVIKKCEGLDLSNFTTVRFRIGDDGATDPGFGALDAFVAMVEERQDR